MTTELLQQALIKWYDSGAENRDEFITLVEQALAQQEQPAQEAVAYELEAVKFGNGKQLVYQKPKNLASYIKVRTLVYADADPAPTQPSQEPVAWYLSEDSNILGVEWSRQKPKYGRDWTPLYKTAPTQPALSDERIDDIAWNYLDKDQKFQWLAFARAIEAHCRGGK